MLLCKDDNTPEWGGNHNPLGKSGMESRLELSTIGLLAACCRESASVLYLFTQAAVSSGCGEKAKFDNNGKNC